MKIRIRIFTYLSAMGLLMALVACSPRHFLTLPDGLNEVNVSGGWDEWTVTVKNKYGSASSNMFAANDHQRSNIYITPHHQLVVIEQGGSDVFFDIPKNLPPEALDGDRRKGRDSKSEDWRYIGVIMNGTLRNIPECIALLGEGSSPYRKRYQVPHFC